MTASSSEHRLSCAWESSPRRRLKACTRTFPNRGLLLRDRCMAWTFTERPSRTILRNRLRVVALPRPDSPVVAVLVMYAAGSVRDPEGLTGLAHLTEHMMFRGSRRFGDGVVDALTNSVGGVNNAMTTNDYAAYYFVLPRESWRVALEIEADRMTGCVMDGAAFETERSVAIEERRMLDDEPEAALDEALELMSYDRHPYRYPVVGLLSDLESVTHDALVSFYRSNYTPDNAVVVVVGDVDPDGVVKTARACFEGLAPADPAEAAPPDPDPERRSPRHVVLERGSGIPRLALGFRCPGAEHPDSPAVELATAMLGSGRSSRLYTRLVADGGDVNEVSVGRALQRYPGLLTITAELSEGGDMESCEAAILEELRRLAGEAPPQAELEKARLQWRLDHSVSRESSLGMAGFLGYWELLDRWELGRDFDAATQAVEPQDVSRVAGLFLDPELRNSAWLTITDR